MTFLATIAVGWLVLAGLYFIANKALEEHPRQAPAIVLGLALLVVFIAMAFGPD